MAWHVSGRSHCSHSMLHDLLLPTIRFFISGYGVFGTYSDLTLEHKGYVNPKFVQDGSHSEKHYPWEAWPDPIAEYLKSYKCNTIFKLLELN